MKSLSLLPVVLLVAFGCGQSEGDRTRDGILRVLRADKAASQKYVGALSADAGSAQRAKAIGDYCTEMERFDMSDCPAEFRVAYRSHLNAWGEVKSAVAQLPDGFFEGVLMGALNSLALGEADGGYNRMQGDLKRALERIRITFEEVERIGAKYGAAL